MALPRDVTQTLGMRDTSHPITQEKPLWIGNRIWRFNPNAHRGLAAAMRYGRKESTGNHVFGHLEKAPLASFIEYAGDVESAQATTGLVFKTGTNARIAAGSRAYFPEIDEIIRFTADFASSTTSAAVARNFGRGVAATSLLSPGMKGVLLLPAFEEGFTTGNGPTNNGKYVSFGVTETSLPYKIGNIEAAEQSRMGDPEREAIRDIMELAKTQKETEMLFGGVVEDSSGTTPIHASDGIDNFISTNVFSLDAPSRMDVWDILLEGKRLAKGLTVDIWCSFAFLGLVAEWAMDRMEITVPVSGQMGQEGSFGLTIDKLKTTAGTFEFHELDILGQEETLMGEAFGVPRGRIVYRPLVWYKNLDLRMTRIERDEVHAVEGELYGVTGWEFFEEERWFKVEDMKFAA